MGTELTAGQKAWSEPFQLTSKLSMRPVDVKRLLGIEHVELNEALLFLNKCKQYGADPYMGDMHMIKYSASSKASIITGVGFFQKKAAVNPRFEGYGKTEWLTDKDGKIQWVDFWVPKIHGKYPLACRASCYIKGFKEVQNFVVNWDENVKKKDEYVDRQKTGKKIINATWDGMPSRMLEKDAIVALLRQVLPNDLGGLYIAEEITGDVMPASTVAPASVKLADQIPKETPAADPKVIHTEGATYKTKDVLAEVEAIESPESGAFNEVGGPNQPFTVEEDQIKIEQQANEGQESEPETEEEMQARLLEEEIPF